MVEKMTYHIITNPVIVNITKVMEYRPAERKKNSPH